MRRLTTKQQIEHLFVMSSDTPVLILKHSTRCPVSSAALDECTEFSKTAKGVSCGVLHVIEERALSNMLAEKTGIRHESPQALLIKNGEVRWHASHDDITIETLQAALA